MEDLHADEQAVGLAAGVRGVPEESLPLFQFGDLAGLRLLPVDQGLNLAAVLREKLEQLVSGSLFLGCPKL